MFMRSSIIEVHLPVDMIWYFEEDLLTAYKKYALQVFIRQNRNTSCTVFEEVNVTDWRPAEESIKLLKISTFLSLIDSVEVFSKTGISKYRHR